MLSTFMSQCYACNQVGVIRHTHKVVRLGKPYNEIAFDAGLCFEHYKDYLNNELKIPKKRQSEEVRKASERVAKHLGNAARNSLQDTEHKNGKNR